MEISKRKCIPNPLPLHPNSSFQPNYRLTIFLGISHWTLSKENTRGHKTLASYQLTPHATVMEGFLARSFIAWGDETTCLAFFFLTTRTNDIYFRYARIIHSYLQIRSIRLLQVGNFSAYLYMFILISTYANLEYWMILHGIMLQFELSTTTIGIWSRVFSLPLNLRVKNSLVI